MSIFIDETTRVLVQGVTGKEGSFWAQAYESVWHQCGGWCNTRQRRTECGWNSGFSYRKKSCGTI